MSKLKTVLALLSLQAVLAGPAAAQTPLEKTIGPDELGAPILITRLEPAVIGKIAKAAGAPMGLELAAGDASRFTTKTPKKLSGLSIRAALDIIASIDPRYEWREMSGVIVLRTPRAWSGVNHPLALPIQPVALRDIRARNALSVAAAFLGAPQYAGTQLSDNKRFSMDLSGGTVLDLLNATVSAHGELAWSFQTQRVDGASILFPYMVTIYAGATGNGCGVPGQAPLSPVNVARYVDPPALAIGGSNAVLDRIVGIGPNELPLILHGPSQSGVLDLANATRVPMGIEFLRPGPGRHSTPPDIAATGRTLREVLDAMVAVDPRYEWREMNGVIVIRPAAAWNDAQSLLFRVVEPIHLIDVAPNEALQRIAREVGYPHPISGISGKPLSLDLAQGTVLDLANAIARAHGELTWALSDEPPLDGAAVGYTSTLTFSVMGGIGFGFGAR